MLTRIYLIKPKADGAKPRLVRATHPSTALRHVAESAYEISVASASDVADLMPKGVQVESVVHEQQELAP